MIYLSVVNDLLEDTPVMALIIIINLEGRKTQKYLVDKGEVEWFMKERSCCKCEFPWFEVVFFLLRTH